jgi:hypothetical protein
MESPHSEKQVSTELKFKERIKMVKFNNTDHAINKNSEDIVYKSVDGSRIVVTREAFLDENPNLTTKDFCKFKNESDKIYHEQAKAERGKTYKNTLFNEYAGGRGEKSPEEHFFAKIKAQEEAEKLKQRVAMAKRALAILTETQRRRYLLRNYNGLKMREIADLEKVSFQKVAKSIAAAQKKINKFLGIKIKK